MTKPVSGEGIPEESNNAILDQKSSAKIDAAASAISTEQPVDSLKEISGLEDNSTRNVVSEAQTKEKVTDSEPIVDDVVQQAAKISSIESDTTLVKEIKAEDNSASFQESPLRSQPSVEHPVQNAGVETSTPLADEAKNFLKSEEKEIPQNKQVDSSQLERTVLPEQQPVRLELAKEVLIQQQFRNSEQIQNNKEVASAAFPISFSTTQSSEILQVIQQNKALAKVTKDVKSHRFALSNTEQAETRLKLLVDSVRPKYFHRESFRPILSPHLPMLKLTAFQCYPALLRTSKN